VGLHLSSGGLPANRRIGVEGGHTIVTPKVLQGGLRCPAIVVRDYWSRFIKVVGSSTRWVAIEFKCKYIIVSAHLPHRRIPTHEFVETLLELQHFLRRFPRHKLIIGMDANARVAGTVDWAHIGPAVPEAELTVRESERAGHLLEFLAVHRLYLANTWTNAEGANHFQFTRRAWDSGSEGQVDFLAISMALELEHSSVDLATTCSSDHFAVAAQVSGMASLRRPPQRTPCIRNWKPAESWSEAAVETNWFWSDWSVCTAQWRELTAAHQAKPPTMEIDAQLEELLTEQKAARPEIRILFNKRIWRRRRHLRRVKAKRALQEACESGRAPPLASGGAHVNWLRLFGDDDPKTQITTFFASLFELKGEEKTKAIEEKQRWIDMWMDFKIDATHSQITVASLKRALKRLKPGKSSPDGVTAEMLKALPEVALTSLARELTRRFSRLEIPESWTQVQAILLPKIGVPGSLAQYRPVSCLKAIRKLWGYLWMDLLPPLRFESLQTAFVKGVDASHGVFVLSKIAELAREWDFPVVAIQLDLKKAFDRVSHVAVVRALRRKGVSIQLVAVLCQMWKQSTVVARLGSVTSSEVTLDRGVPQGAPESPIIFTCVIDDILARLFVKWKAKGWGWAMDGFWLAALGYADDIILVARSKVEAQLMLKDCIEEFSAAGLEIGMEKTHWSSSHPMDGQFIVTNGVKVQWESHLTFVGTVLELGGHSARALQYRLAQATKAFARWSPMLLCRWLPLPQRLRALKLAIGSSATWLSSTWHLTRAQENRFASWGARMASRVKGVRRHPDEELGQFWRRLHREGHSLMQRFDWHPVHQCRRMLHRFAGHTARAPELSTAKQVLLLRPMAWWRDEQSRWRCKWSGLHPRRFNCWRWESQLTSFYGDVAAKKCSPMQVGWMAKAQDREQWKAAENAFAMRV
jgi:hypothetical protein